MSRSWIGVAGALLLLWVGASAAHSSPLFFSLHGEWRMESGEFATTDRFREDLDDSGWELIRVPSNWFTEGHDLSGSVWFRHRFEAPALFQDRTNRLFFEGVDYTADVWLNGEHLGFNEGYFMPFSFDVSKTLAYGGENVLVVRVTSPLETPSAWSLRKRLIKGIFSHHDTRPGGAWSERGQEQNTGGIWASVYLRSSIGLQLEEPRVTPIVTDPLATVEPVAARAEVEVTLIKPGIDTLVTDLDVTIVPYASAPDAEPCEATSKRVTLSGSGSKTAVFSVDCPEVYRWWTWDHGSPRLYRATVTARSGNEVLDQRETSFGFRTVNFDETTETLYLNGRPFFARGTNYIATQWLSEMTTARYARDLSMMRDANINAVRVHAHVAAKEFYQQSDRAGLLVWQDFPLQWGYEETETFAREAERQAEEMVNHLYNHPSIAVWSAHNEPPWDADWMKFKYPDYAPGQNDLLDERLQQTLLTADETRYSRKCSSTVEHPWLGWYSGHWLDYAKPTKQPLITEFGAQSLPRIESLRKIFTEDEIWPDTDAEWRKWDYHNFQRHETFEVAGVEQGSTIEEWIESSQSYQTDITTLAAESYRRQKYEPVTGIYQFMFVEDWPSLNWGIVDYWRHTKPAYEALRRAYQPVLPSIAWDKKIWPDSAPVDLEIWIVNDLHRALGRLQLTWTLLDLGSGAAVASSSLSTTAPTDSSKKILSLSKRLASGDYRFDVRLRSDDGEIDASNTYTFAVRPIPQIP